MDSTEYTLDIHPGNARAQVIAGAVVLMLLLLVVLVGPKFLARPTFQAPGLPGIAQMAQMNLPAQMEVTNSTLCFGIKKKMRARMELSKSDVRRFAKLLKEQGFSMSESDRVGITEFGYPRVLAWWKPGECRSFVSAHRKNADGDTRVVVSLDDADRATVYLLWEEIR